MNSSYMKKFHSFPVLGLIQKEASSLNVINSKIYMLSGQTLEKIMMYFSYHEIVKIRCVCNWFNSVAGSILNKKFLSLPETVDQKLTEIISASKVNPKLFGYLKVLYIVKAEMKILQACCEEYVINNTFFFNGGSIVDIIESILSSSDTLEASDLVAKLLIENDKFLDNFDNIIEPILQEKSVCISQSLFAKKIVDIFECSLNCDKNIELWPSTGARHGHCYLKGTYESRKVYSIKPPPSLPPNEKISSSEINGLIKYLRNYVRWNNTLNYQLLDDIDIVSEEDFFDGVNQLIFKRKFPCNNIPYGPMRLIIDFDLYCLKVFAPVKYQKYLQDINNSFDSKESILFSENDYKFYLKLEIGYIEIENGQSVAKLKNIKLKQKAGVNMVICETKKMVLND